MKKASIWRGFTIVELLVVIVVIGVLASITVVSYTGISTKATIATLSSELNSASRQLKLFQVENGVFPISVSDCPNPANDNMCLKTVDGLFYRYSIDNTINPQNFLLVAEKNNIKYDITNNSAPFAHEQVVATGGSISDIDGYRIHTFISDGNFVITNGGYVEYLIVAGGGGGQNNLGGATGTGAGGGGAGGFIMGVDNITPASYPVVVGAGGANMADATAQGGNSSFLSLVAIGGGRGGSRWTPAANGGSGGGSGYNSASIPGIGTIGQGHAGGPSVTVANFGGGGGGGATSAGQPGSAINGGAGGAGFYSAISGIVVGYCGGGGGAIGGSAVGPEGEATHGGGRGGNGTQSGANAQPNTGGGGGGSPSTSQSTGIGGLGGSGVVIIRYPR